ncbi:sulfotransferase [Bacteroidota bacterium]
MARKKKYTLEELKKINEERDNNYKLNINEEYFLQNFNSFLSGIGNTFIQSNESPKLPVLFIVGTPRSGSSLLYQILANSNEFTYLSNFSARFWEAPYIGLMLEKIMQVRESVELSFTSDFGKTEDGLHSPHEVMYFWDKWFAHGQEEQEVPKEMLTQIDTQQFKKEVAAIEQVYNKPVLFKSQFWLTLQMDFLSKVFPNSLFISTSRNPIYVAQSIALGRKKILGDINKWWSIKPKEYHELKNLHWSDQIIGQVFYTEKKMNESLKKLPDNRKINTSYQDLCSNPKEVLKELETKFKKFGISLELNNKQLRPFKVADNQKIDDSEFQSLINSYQNFYKEEPNL